MEKTNKNIAIFLLTASIVILAMVFDFEQNNIFMLLAIIFIFVVEGFTLFRIKEFFKSNFRLSWMLLLINVISLGFWIYLVLEGHPSALIGGYALSLLTISIIDNND